MVSDYLSEVDAPKEQPKIKETKPETDEKKDGLVYF